MSRNALAGSILVTIPIRPAGMTYERAMSIAMSVDAKQHGILVTPDEAAERWPVKRQKLVTKPQHALAMTARQKVDYDIERLAMEGLNDKQIAEHVPLSRKAVGESRRRLGIPPQPITRNHNQELHRALLEGYRAGRTDKQTADLLGMSRQIVAQARIRYGIPVHKAPR